MRTKTKMFHRCGHCGTAQVVRMDAKLVFGLLMAMGIAFADCSAMGWGSVASCTAEASGIVGGILILAGVALFYVTIGVVKTSGKGIMVLLRPLMLGGGFMFLLVGLNIFISEQPAYTDALTGLYTLILYTFYLYLVLVFLLILEEVFLYAIKRFNITF